MGVVEFVLRPEVAYVAGGGMILLAVLLVALDPRNRVAGSFAAFLVLRGVANLPRRIVNPIDDYLILLLPFAALWFLIEYYRRARLQKGHPVTLAALAVLAVLVTVSWKTNLRAVLPDRLHLVNLLFPGRFLAYALIAFTLAIAAISRRRPTERWPFLAVSAAFALNPLFYSLIWFRQRGVPPPFHSLEFLLPHLITTLAFLLICATVLFLTFRLAWRPGSLRLRELVAYQAALFVVAMSMLFVLADPTWGFEWTERGHAFDRLYTLPIPFVIGYLLLRHRLFDLDLRFKATLVHALFAVVLTVAFFVSKELLEDIVEFDGPWLGLVGAALVGIAFQPIERHARRLMDGIMPGVDATPEYLERRKLEVYRSTAETVLQDARLTSRERHVLDRLREGLGIDAKAALAIEDEIARRVGAHATGVTAEATA